MLKQFVTTLDEAMMMVSSLRAVYSNYLVKPVPPYKMKSVSCEGTLNGCIIEARLSVHVCVFQLAVHVIYNCYVYMEICE